MYYYNVLYPMITILISNFLAQCMLVGSTQKTTTDIYAKNLHFIQFRVCGVFMLFWVACVPCTRCLVLSLFQCSLSYYYRFSDTCQRFSPLWGCIVIGSVARSGVANIVIAFVDYKSDNSILYCNWTLSVCNSFKCH